MTLRERRRRAIASSSPPVAAASARRRSRRRIALWGALAGTPDGRAHDRPGATARDVAGPRNARQRARARSRATLFAAQGLEPDGPPRGDDARPEGRVGRAGRAPRAAGGARQRILENPFYQHLSQTFAGSQEYMAIEQLCVLAESGRYDLIVVDTPPTRHALDFLEAPERLGDFLDKSVVKWFVRPYVNAGWSALRAVNRTRRASCSAASSRRRASRRWRRYPTSSRSMSGLFDNFQRRIEHAYRGAARPRDGVRRGVEPRGAGAGGRRVPGQQDGRAAACR